MSIGYVRFETWVIPKEEFSSQLFTNENCYFETINKIDKGVDLSEKVQVQDFHPDNSSPSRFNTFTNIFNHNYFPFNKSILTYRIVDGYKENFDIKDELNTNSSYHPYQDNYDFDISEYSTFNSLLIDTYQLPNEYNHILKDIKIKFEVNINPPIGATYEQQYKLLPSPHEIKLYDKESLFAGKIHAILCRNWSFRTKGRDLYDYIFFLANNTKVNLNLIKNKLIESKFIEKDSKFDIDILKRLLIDKFKNIDYNDAIEDVKPFIKNIDSLKLWNPDFFIKITNKLN